MAITEEGYDYDETTLHITNCGAYEGQPRYLPYFYSCWLNGDGDLNDDGTVTFVVTPGELASFPELAGRKTVNLFHDDQGFIYEV